MCSSCDFFWYISSTLVFFVLGAAGGEPPFWTDAILATVTLDSEVFPRIEQTIQTKRSVYEDGREGSNDIKEKQKKQKNAGDRPGA